MDISRADRRGRLRQSECSPVRRPRRRRGLDEARLKASEVWRARQDSNLRPPA